MARVLGLGFMARVLRLGLGSRARALRLGSGFCSFHNSR